MLLAIRQTTVDGMNVKQHRIVRYLHQRVHLGTPALYTHGGNVWYVYDDHKFEGEDLAILGCVAANWADIGAYDPAGKTQAEIRADIRAFIAAKIVWPVTIPDGTTNPYQYILTAQGAPAVIRASSGIPDGWTAVTTA